MGGDLLEAQGGIFDVLDQDPDGCLCAHTLRRHEPRLRWLLGATTSLLRIEGGRLIQRRSAPGSGYFFVPHPFEEISIEMTDWKATFLNLIQQGKRIHYDVHTMPTIAKEIRAELNKWNYFDFILEPDRDHHFLVPKSN
jgi:hypothetical protein